MLTHAAFNYVAYTRGPLPHAPASNMSLWTRNCRGSRSCLRMFTPIWRANMAYEFIVCHVNITLS